MGFFSEAKRCQGDAQQEKVGEENSGIVPDILRRAYKRNAGQRADTGDQGQAGEPISAAAAAPEMAAIEPA